MTVWKLTPADAGCYVDGHHGWHGHAMMLELAHELGWPLSEEDHVMILAHDSGEDTIAGEVTLHEHIYAMMDDAESWLNEHAAPDGYSFGWHDGDFFLSPNHGDETAWCAADGSSCEDCELAAAWMTYASRFLAPIRL